MEDMYGAKHQDIVDKIEQLRQSWLKDKKLRRERALKNKAKQDRKTTPLLPGFKFTETYDSLIDDLTQL